MCQRSRRQSDPEASGGKVRFRNRSEPEPNARSGFKFSEYLNLNARFGSAFGGDQARSNAERKIEPEVKISVTLTANQHHGTSMLSAHNLAQDVMRANPTPLGTILYIRTTSSGLDTRIGLPPVAVVTVPRHPWHGYPSRAVEDFSLRKTARKTRPSRPWNGFSVPTLTVPLVSAFEASRVLNMPLNEISEQLKYRNLPRIDGGV
ncbi:hypothetical protein C8J57DRAFT_1244710 [Mycena rebaudengoi]|nr:hypothetical protein C8J57DRAFT_1244710 [Mycena rebaudengoi]